MLILFLVDVDGYKGWWEAVGNSENGQKSGYFIGLDKQKTSALNCKYFLTHNF